MSGTCIGIDNGISGALAAIMDDGTVDVISMPTVTVGKSTFIDACALEDWLLKHSGWSKLEGGVPRVTFEQGSKQPKFGTKGNFANGYSFGVVKTVLELQARRGNLVFQCVNAKTWQKVLFKDLRGADVEGSDTKGASLEVCRRLFPTVNLVPPRCRVPNDGWADALCMASYSFHTLRG